MAPARVAVGTLASSATSSITPAFGATTTAGNFLVLYAAGNSNIGFSAITGWTLLLNQGGGGGCAAVFIKPNCGAGETAPTANLSAATLMEARLEEWSGLGTTDPTDQSRGSQGVTTLALSAPDATASDVFLGVAAAIASKSQTVTFSATLTPAGGTSLNTANDGATKQLFHAFFFSQIMSSNASADQIALTATPSTGTVAVNLSIASFKPPASASGPQSPPIVVRQAVARAGNF